MKFKLLQYKENIYASYWIVPSFLSVLSIIISVLVLYADKNKDLYWLSKVYLVQGIELSGAQTLFSTVATSVLAITSVSFSITILILSLAANQLGPRLLPNFMKQGQTQFVLGVFAAVFIYSLVNLLSVSALAHQGHLPYLSVVVGEILAIVCVFVLIYFIHYVSQSIKVDNVLAALSADLAGSIKRQLPKREVGKSIEVEPYHGKQELQHGYPVIDYLHISATGYIQTISYNALLSLAKNHKLKMKVRYKPGDFVFMNLPVVEVYCQSELKQSTQQQILDCFQIGLRRTVVQDIEYAFEQVTEIAVRALSPGINNPYTAINCLDQIAYGFAVLNNHVIPSNLLRNEKNEPLVEFEQLTYEGIVDNTLHRFRQEAVNDLSVATRLLDVVFDLLQIGLVVPLKRALFNQAELVYQACAERNISSSDKDDLKFRYDKIKRQLFGMLY